MVFNIVLGFDWDRMSLTLAIYPGGIAFGPSTPSADLIDDPLTLATAAPGWTAETATRPDSPATGTR